MYGHQNQNVFWNEIENIPKVKEEMEMNWKMFPQSSELGITTITTENIG